MWTADCDSCYGGSREARLISLLGIDWMAPKLAELDQMLETADQAIELLLVKLWRGMCIHDSLAKREGMPTILANSVPIPANSKRPDASEAADLHALASR